MQVTTTAENADVYMRLKNSIKSLCDTPIDNSSTQVSSQALLS